MQYMRTLGFIEMSVRPIKPLCPAIQDGPLNSRFCYIVCNLPGDGRGASEDKMTRGDVTGPSNPHHGGSWDERRCDRSSGNQTGAQENAGDQGEQACMHE